MRDVCHYRPRLLMLWQPHGSRLVTVPSSWTPRTNNSLMSTNGSRFVSNGPEMYKILREMNPKDRFLVNLENVSYGRRTLTRRCGPTATVQEPRQNKKPLQNGDESLRWSAPRSRWSTRPTPTRRAINSSPGVSYMLAPAASLLMLPDCSYVSNVSNDNALRVGLRRRFPGTNTSMIPTRWA